MSDAAAGEPSVVLERRGRVGHIRLNRPRAINALNAEMLAIVIEALEEWAGDDSVATVLLTGSGERGLCAGGDIVSIYEDARTGGEGSERFWRDEYLMNATIARYPKPFVAIQDGLVLGGGIGLSAHGSVRIVTERSKLGMPETGIGFVPDVGGTFLLSRAPGELGTHLGLTAGSVGAADAILLGLADHFIPSSRIEGFVTALETSGADAAAASFAEQAPPGVLADQRAWIDPAYTGDDVQTILDRLAALGTEPAVAARDAIAAKSPTALKTTLAALRRAARLPDLETDLEQELRVSLRFLDEPDLAEGIRAQVIDKDRTPHWNPPTLAAVDDDHIDSLFASLGERELALPRIAH